MENKKKRPPLTNSNNIPMEQIESGYECEERKIQDNLMSDIDKMSFRQILEIWRFAKSNSPYVQGIVGKHLKEKMIEKRNELPHSEQVQISKSVGWG